MKKLYQILLLIFLFINLATSEFASLTDGAMYAIDEDLDPEKEYKTKRVTYEASDTINYLKYDFTNMPDSLITAFKIEITPYSSKIMGYKVFCINVVSGTTDDALKIQLDSIKDDESKSSCIDINKNYGYHDSIMKLDPSKPKIGIGIYIPQRTESTTVQINLRIAEKKLEVKAETHKIEEVYSKVPLTVNISEFRSVASKVLFYSSSDSLQMYESVSLDAFPTKLFLGNILNVYTNPLMVLQKYHNAKIMTLLANSFGIGLSASNRTFQVSFFQSNYLLDYYVSSNPDGRPLNTPLLINMTQCTSPYYVILNYNAYDYGKTLILDEIYGKLSYLGVATTLVQDTWEKMIENDIQTLDINEKKYNLPMSANNLDVYKLECTLPIMLNFYYVDLKSPVYTMNLGDVQIFNLKPYQTITVPFVANISLPEILIEINQPDNNPYVIVVVMSEEKVFRQNALERYVPMNVEKGIILMERGGSSDTRVIIKVGFPINSWKPQGEYIKFNEDEKIYLFEFPNDALNKYFYTMADLTISGSNADDNVKFCFTTSIGGALKPSSENCYRVSKTNSYTLKVYNPFIMYKNYQYSEDLRYSVTMKPVTDAPNFGILVKVDKYDTNVRNYEGVNSKLTLSSQGNYSSILTPPKLETNTIFLQIQVCDEINSINTKVIDILTQEVLLPEEKISPGLKNQYRTFLNKLMDTEFYVSGTEGTNVFLRMVGLNTLFTPSFKSEPQIYFENDTNALTLESPLTTTEDMRMTVLIDKENVLVNKAYTLCSFVGKEFQDLAKYHKTVTIKSGRYAYVQINFEEAGINPGEKFDALIYYEHLTKGQMVFLSKVYQNTVGNITLETIHAINDTFSEDNNYLYKTIDIIQSNYYFSYMPESALDVPIGSFSIELDDQTSGEFIGVYCTFVSKDADAMTMIDAVETAFQEDKSYCLGSKSSIYPKRYNYIFKYEYEKDNTPKKMVIKAVNDNKINGPFNIYIKKDQGEEIEATDFLAQKEYGKEEIYKKSVIPYIVDLTKIRGKNDTDYISKVLFYSKYLEMQMYYVPKDSNKPIRLFTGNIALVYTKPALAEQKYHSTVLVLITENLEGESHASIGANFRFHTKMFRSSAMIEYFVSQNPSGRTLNFPLSLEMNTCNDDNNKLYYLLNYNEAESLRRLHLDMIFGKYIRARIAKEINQEHWDALLLDSSSMVEIKDFKAELPTKSQHIEVIEVTCSTPLLMNAYYTKDDLFYVDIEKGGVVLKNLPAQSSYQFSFKAYNLTSMEYTISLYNPTESPDVTVSFSDGTQHYFTGNSLQSGITLHIPERVNIINNVKSETRFIFKFGLAVETSPWQEDKIAGIEGKLYFNQNAFVYKFPTTANKLKYQTVDFLVKSIDDKPNTKFCYSTNLGTAIETSRENCFRTGKNIPYQLTFINPLIMGKNYYTETDRYYITLKPFDAADSIKVEITENKNNIDNRNELGVAKELNIKNGIVSTILSMPIEPQKIFFQIKSCKASTDPIRFRLYNAFTGKSLHNGTTYFTDPYGVYYISENNYMENQLDLLGEDVNMFTKHAAISDDYAPSVNPNYTISFDSGSNVVNIIKPILGETFNITVIIKKTSLEGLTICDLSFHDKSKLGDYVNSFVSTTSDRIIHFVDFSKMDGYPKGTEFWLMVYAEQMQNSKMEFIYPAIKGVVGSASGTVKVETIIEGESEYITAEFAIKTSSNYLYYDFPRTPTGNVASVRIKSGSIRVNKIGCTFVSNTATEEQMINLVNIAMIQGTSCCIGENYVGITGYDALVNANYTVGKNRMVIQVLYALGENGEENDENTANIIIKNGGTELTTQEEFPSSEPYSAIPYVIDLLKIRGDKKEGYVSKILFYSNTREMQMFYIPENSKKPMTLFTGNIMMVYTNPELIKQKYQGATTMILLTDALSSTERFIFGESYRFISYFFTSEVNIQYFLSNNAEGRPLNNPTAVEMTSCEQPYYYIMNYNKLEGKKRKLHIDTVYGEKNTIKLAPVLNEASWEALIKNLIPVGGDEVVLEEQHRFHFDVIEITCNVPLLVNLFYTDPEETKVTNLEMGDITILSLEKGKTETLTFKLGEKGPFVYSFTIEKKSKNGPKISINFDEMEEVIYTENGVYTKYAVFEYNKIVISNKDNSGNVNTRVIFKFGYAIEVTFEQDENGVYSNKNDPDRVYNLYGYIYDQTSAKYNYTGMDFYVTTTEENVKFCYSTNLGTYIYPSLQNCYRIGIKNPYMISTLNPSVMYRDYVSDEHMNYYVGFRTVEKNQNIMILPIAKKYDTTERNFEGQKNKVKISSDTGEISTILTAPKNHDPFIFVEICLCTRKAHVSYQFLNAYNHSHLGSDGELNNNSPKISAFANPKLDTELRIYKGQNGNEVFVKHSGYDKKSVLSQRKIEVEYNNQTRYLSWTQPLMNENFNYTLYFDKINNIKKQNYTLCHIAEVTRLSHNFISLVTNSRNPNITVDYSKIGLKEDEQFDVIIVAEQTDKQKFTFISATYDSLGGNNDESPEEETDKPPETKEPESKTGLIVVISILSVVIIGGGIAAVLIFMKYRKKTRIIEENKQTSMALLGSTQQDKLVESQVQVDP